MAAAKLYDKLACKLHAGSSASCHGLIRMQRSFQKNARCRGGRLTASIPPRKSDSFKRASSMSFAVREVTNLLARQASPCPHCGRRDQRKQYGKLSCSRGTYSARRRHNTKYQNHQTQVHRSWSMILQRTRLEGAHDCKRRRGRVPKSRLSTGRAALRCSEHSDLARLKETCQTPIKILNIELTSIVNTKLLKSLNTELLKNLDSELLKSLIACENPRHTSCFKIVRKNKERHSITSNRYLCGSNTQNF